MEKRVSAIDYHLSLPKTMRIHPVFHVSILEPAPANSRPHRYEIEVYDEEFEPEEILEKENRNGEIHYLEK